MPSLSSLLQLAELSNRSAAFPMQIYDGHVRLSDPDVLLIRMVTSSRILFRVS